MTEYEAAHLFKELIVSVVDTSMNYVTVLFAFLVASYLAAPRLSNVMSGIVVALFTFFSLVMIFITNRTMAATTSLVESLRAAPGEAVVSWHPIIYQPANYGHFITPTYTSLLLLSLMAGIIFFFLCRRGLISN